MRPDRDGAPPGSGPPPQRRVSLRTFGAGLALAAVARVALTFVMGLTPDPTATFITVALGLAGVLLFLSGPGEPPRSPL